MRAVAAAIVLVAGLLAGCALLPSPSEVPVEQLPIGQRVAVPAAQLRVTAINQTSIPVVLVVNGRPRDMAPGSSQDLGVVELGPLPWDFHVTNAAGRELLAGTLHDGDIWRQNDGNGQSDGSGFEARADLSCGQLFIVSHVASYGPAPGPGVPGDCD